MAYKKQEVDVLKKYRILNPDGKMRMVNLKHPAEKPLGPGPIVSKDALATLLAADTTLKKQWLDWIFFQAGGGGNADTKTAVNKALVRIKDGFIKNRMSGWTVNGVHRPGVSSDQAERLWAVAEKQIKELLAVGDQDAVEKLGIFGYYRNWPGNNQIYAKVVEAIERFLKLRPKIEEYNVEVAAQANAILSDTPGEIPTIQRMNDISDMVEHHFAAKIARTDIRFANDNKPIYDDDNITAVAPLTYAAAVKAGYDLWPWANRQAFDNLLKGGPKHSVRDSWKQHTQGGRIIVYFTFKVPVPAWVSKEGKGPEIFDFTDLAIGLGKESASEDTDEWIVHDQENRSTMTIAEIKQAIFNEPDREDEESEDSLWHRGSNVTSRIPQIQPSGIPDENDAQISNVNDVQAVPEKIKNLDKPVSASVVASLDRACRAVQRWLATFDTKLIKSNALSLD